MDDTFRPGSFMWDMRLPMGSFHELDLSQSKTLEMFGIEAMSNVDHQLGKAEQLTHLYMDLGLLVSNFSHVCFTSNLIHLELTASLVFGLAPASLAKLAELIQNHQTLSHLAVFHPSCVESPYVSILLAASRNPFIKPLGLDILDAERLVPWMKVSEISTFNHRETN
jgi:hypothetical protein